MAAVVFAGVLAVTVAYLAALHSIHTRSRRLAELEHDLLTWKTPCRRTQSPYNLDADLELWAQLTRDEIAALPETREPAA